MPEFPVRPLYKLKMLAGACRDPRCPVATQVKPPIKFRCLLNLSLISIEWSDPFSVFLRAFTGCGEGSSFRFYLRDLCFKPTEREEGSKMPILS